MENKKFTSYFELFIGIFIIISLIYIVSLKKTREVSDYKLSEEISYSGKIVENKFSGQGELKSPYGAYSGNFEDGRFKGEGKFVNENFTYEANFDKDKGNKDIKITLKDGSVYKKVNDTWRKIDEKNKD